MGSKIRPPAVAGVFYPADRAGLAATIDKLLEKAPDFKLRGIRALIAPHAGYVYSGPVAAVAYRQIRGTGFRRVVLLAPSHFCFFRGVTVVTEGFFSTPLGLVPIDPVAEELANRPPFFREEPLPAELPGWARHSFWTGAQREFPHRWEHSIEVHIPFLQRVLNDFSLVPTLFGEVDPEEVAEVLLPFVDAQTLFVASSDLSHYLPHEEAVLHDRQTLEAICRLDVKAAPHLDACGRLPIATLIHMALRRGWHAQLLEHKTSGDTSGDYEAVVGYGAVAFCSPEGAPVETPAEKKLPRIATPDRGNASEDQPEQPKTEEQPVLTPDRSLPWGFSAEEKRILLRLAREAIRSAVCQLSLPSVNPDELPEKLRRPGACFVTLKVLGQLRGCIGTLQPKEPLYLAVIRRAESAATADPRFPPVTPEELDLLSIEISALSPCRQLNATTPEEILAQIEPGKHGVVLRVGSSHATFLPQVWEHFADKTQFLEKLAVKAGLFPDAWRRPDAKIEVYEVEIVADDENGMPASSEDQTA